MKTLSIREMRAALGRLDELLEDECEIVVARRGRPIARILPLTSPRSMPSHADLRAAMAEIGDSAQAIREDRDAR